MDLRYVVYPWVVDCAALRTAGWRPGFGNEEALRVLLDQRKGRDAVAGRRIARKEATITAAGGDRRRGRDRRHRPPGPPPPPHRLSHRVTLTSERRATDRRARDRAVRGRGPGRGRGPAAGGIALFAGAVRDSDHDQGVTGLSYSAHPSAEDELRRVAEAIAEKFHALGVAAVHRVGDLDVGDLAVVVAVACPHRADRFAACRALIDELKATVPIWKHQRFTDGSSRVGRQPVYSGFARSLKTINSRSLTLFLASVGTAAAIAVGVLIPVPYVILGPGPHPEHAGPGLVRAVP